MRQRRQRPDRELSPGCFTAKSTSHGTVLSKGFAGEFHRREKRWVYRNNKRRAHKGIERQSSSIRCRQAKNVRTRHTVTVTIFDIQCIEGRFVQHRHAKHTDAKGWRGKRVRHNTIRTITKSFYPHLYSSISTRKRLYTQRSSGQAEVTRVFPSPPLRAFIFIAQRVQHSHFQAFLWSSIFIEFC